MGAGKTAPVPFCHSQVFVNNVVQFWGNHVKDSETEQVVGQLFPGSWSRASFWSRLLHGMCSNQGPTRSAVWKRIHRPAVQNVISGLPSIYCLSFVSFLNTKLPLTFTLKSKCCHVLCPSRIRKQSRLGSYMWRACLWGTMILGSGSMGSAVRLVILPTRLMYLATPKLSKLLKTRNDRLEWCPLT